MLLTKALLREFQKQGDTSELPAESIPVIAKFFNPGGSGTWYAVEFDPEERIFFGYVTGLGYDELGSFSLDEFVNFRGRFGLGIERDRYFRPRSVTLREVMDGRRPWWGGGPGSSSALTRSPGPKPREGGTVYDIVRYYQSARIRRRVIREAVTLEEAKRHCNDPESSSDTCTSNVGKARTRKLGAWFDGFRRR